MEGQKNKYYWVLLFLCLATVFLYAKMLWAQNEIIVNEIMYNPEGADTDKEWLEIKNLTDQDIDITGYKLNDGSSHVLNIPPKNGGRGELILPANGLLIIAQNAEWFLDNYSNIDGSVIDSSFSLKNTSGNISLLNPEGESLATIQYNSDWGGNGDGTSLVNIDSKWQSSSSLGGSPGRENTISQNESSETETPMQQTTSQTISFEEEILKTDVVAQAGPDITALSNQEINFDASGSQGDLNYFFWNFGDGETFTGKQQVSHAYLFPGVYIASLTVGDGNKESTDMCRVTILANNIKITEFLPWAIEKDTENEWIELYNSSSSPANLTGWQLDDAEKGSKPFIFEKGSLMAPQSYLVLSRTVTKIALNNNGDSVRLLFPDGHIAQQIDYQKAKKGQSVSVFSDQSFYWTNFPTPGFVNFPPDNQSAEANPLPFTPTVNNQTVNFISAVEKTNLIPFISGVQAKEDSLLNDLWQKTILPITDQSNPNYGLNQNGTQEKATLKDNDLPSSEKLLLKGFLSKNNQSLIVLLISLVLSLSLFGFWFLRFIKK